MKEFVVTGKTRFPLEMLWREKCWPASQYAVTEILLSFTMREKKLAWRVRLCSHSVPHPHLWADYGWEVL